jgi:hypothetical protein
MPCSPGTRCQSVRCAKSVCGHDGRCQWSTGLSAVVFVVYCHCSYAGDGIVAMSLFLLLHLPGEPICCHDGWWHGWNGWNGRHARNARHRSNDAKPHGATNGPANHVKSSNDATGTSVLPPCSSLSLSALSCPCVTLSVIVPVDGGMVFCKFESSCHVYIPRMQMVQMNPMLQQMSQSNPMMAQMLSNPDFMRHSMQMMQVIRLAPSLHQFTIFSINCLRIAYLSLWPAVFACRV